MRRTPVRDRQFDETRVLSEILNTTDPWRIAGRARLDFPRLVRTLKRLRRRGLLRTAPGEITLTPKGRTVARRQGLRPAKDIAAAVELGRKRFRRIAGRRPPSISLYNQGYMTADSVLRRVGLVAAQGDADCRKIAVLGDDDLVSIALCLCSRPESVTVFEIDSRIVDFILDIGGSMNLPIRAECVDLREPLPPKLKGRFDTFVTDPSETLPGLKMFLGRGLFLLRPGEGRAGYFGLTRIEASALKWNRLERWLVGTHSVAITHVLPETARYHNWDDLQAQTASVDIDCFTTPPKAKWFKSSLIRLETLEGFEPAVTGKARGSIFMDDEACGRIVEEVK